MITEADVQKLRDAGISDATIRDMQREEEDKDKGVVAVTPATPGALPVIDPNTPSQTVANAQEAGVPTTGQGQTWAQTGVEAMTLIPDALKYGGAGYGAYKAGQYIGAKSDLARAQAQSVRANLPTPERTFNTLKTPEAQLNAARGPVAPTTAPTQAPVAQQPNILQRGMDTANKMRQIAAERVIQPAAQAVRQGAAAVAPYAARAGAGVTAAVMPGNMGQNYPFPQSGPMRGMEINPTTGRPWTPEELQAYNSQPGMR